MCPGYKKTTLILLELCNNTPQVIPNFLRRQQWRNGTQKESSFVPPPICCFYNKEGSSWHFNLSDHNLNQPIKNSCFMLQYLPTVRS